MRLKERCVCPSCKAIHKTEVSLANLGVRGSIISIASFSCVQGAFLSNEGQPGNYSNGNGRGRLT